VVFRKKCTRQQGNDDEWKVNVTGERNWVKKEGSGGSSFSSTDDDGVCLRGDSIRDTTRWDRGEDLQREID